MLKVIQKARLTDILLHLNLFYRTPVRGYPAFSCPKNGGRKGMEPVCMKHQAIQVNILICYFHATLKNNLMHLQLLFRLVSLPFRQFVMFATAPVSYNMPYCGFAQSKGNSATHL